MDKKKSLTVHDDVRSVGVHLIIELWNGKNLTSISKIKRILKDGAKACGATLIKIALHRFSSSGGVTGVAILKESHISIHTWPEYGYIALDIFLCRNLDPYRAIAAFRKGFKPKSIQVSEFKRGILVKK